MKTLLLSTVCVLFSITAFAHRVNIFAELDGNIIKTESYYPNGSKVRSGEIKIIESINGKVLLNGKTNTKGMMEFPIPAQAIKDKSGIKIVLYAGMGHKTNWDFAYDELKESIDILNDKSGKLIQEHAENNKLKEKHEVKASGISIYQVLSGLAIIWIIFGSIYFFKKKSKGK